MHQAECDHAVCVLCCRSQGGTAEFTLVQIASNVRYAETSFTLLLLQFCTWLFIEIPRVHYVCPSSVRKRYRDMNSTQFVHKENFVHLHIMRSPVIFCIEVLR